MKALGRHLLAEFFECNSSRLNDIKFIEKVMKNAAVVSGATIVNTSFHKFEPQGVSGVVVISESHLSIHTWPEYGYAAIDLFTCGENVDPWKAYEYLKEVFSSQRTKVEEIKRGLYPEIGLDERAPYKTTLCNSNLTNDYQLKKMS